MKTNKKTAAVLLLVILTCTMLPAQSGQKIFRVDSPIYNTIRKIYLLQGLAMPSSTGPWSAAEFELMLGKIDTDDLSPQLHDEYDAALAEVRKNGEKGDEHITTTVSRSLNTEAYIHTNTDGSEIQGVTDSESWNKQKLYTGREGWQYDLTKIKPFYEMNWETWVSDMFYGWFEFPLQNTYRTRTLLGEKNVSTNIVAFQNSALEGGVIDMSFPYRAFIGFGGDSWSFELGRDRLSWGLGTTGNLLMSDNFPFHNMLRYTAFSNSYKYTFLLSTYAHEKNYYYGDGGTVKYHLTNSDHSDVEGNEFYLSHRVEGRFFGDKLAGAITESLIVQYATNRIPFELFNPVLFWHNSYTASTANSILGFDLDYTPFKGFNVYGQFAIDEIQLLGENTQWPNGLGFLGGVTYARPLLDGVMTLNLEGVHTDPYMYLRYATWQSNDAPYGIDFIVADRIYSNDLDCRVSYEEFCLGYPYGPDTAVGNFSCKWEGAKLSLNANYFFMAHGTHDFWTKWAMRPDPCSDEYNQQNYVTPTTSHDSSANQRFDVSNRDSVCYTNAIALGASYQALPSLKVFGEADYVITKNAFNDSHNGTENDLQLVLGMKWSF